MPYRGDPEKICQAQRAGMFMRLVSAERLDAFDAEHWISRWEREAEANGPAVGSQAYWDAAWSWITENRRSIEEPTPCTTAGGWNARRTPGLPTETTRARRPCLGLG